MDVRIQSKMKKDTFVISGRKRKIHMHADTTCTCICPSLALLSGEVFNEASPG